jgi:hypothetical protein
VSDNIHMGKKAFSVKLPHATINKLAEIQKVTGFEKQDIVMWALDNIDVEHMRIDLNARNQIIASMPRSVKGVLGNLHKMTDEQRDILRRAIDAAP